ncbi:hypothetical protein B0J17DRAFT_626523 [Rhizoctonia solani]|nr:hypothetical protein B0J17DRAFT_626523 [Rhizoctonia solani]
MSMTVLILIGQPSVLQAPKENDMSAKELAGHVAGLLNLLDTALLRLNNAGELGQLYGISWSVPHKSPKDCSRRAGGHPSVAVTTKLASQTGIRDRILQLKEEISRAVSDLTLRLLVLTLAGNMRDHRRTPSDLRHTHKVTMHTHKTTIRIRQSMARQQSALCKVSTYRMYMWLILATESPTNDKP